jgi:hypothetical protein
MNIKKDFKSGGIIMPEIKKINYTFDKFGENSFFFIHKQYAYFTEKIEYKKIDYLRDLFESIIQHKHNIKFLKPSDKTLELLKEMNFYKGVEYIPQLGNSLMWCKCHLTKDKIKQDCIRGILYESNIPTRQDY